MLNEKQQEAVNATEGPVLVLAGAGAGKTRVLTNRILNIIKKGKADAHEILAITFTNKAAKEMRDRVNVLLDSDPDINRPVSARYSGMGVPFVSTFHSLGVHILRENHRRLNINKTFTILDRQDSLKLIKEALKQMMLDPKDEDPKSILGRISRAKSDALTPSLYFENVNSYETEKTARVWELYESAKRKEGALDFDDLLTVPLKLLQEDESVLKHYQETWKYILVDEYQDTNKVQFEMIRLLAAKHGNIFVVGDEDQCLYTWRSASIENILNFENHFKGAKVVLLEQNYRSTKNIIAAANAVISKNQKRQDKNLFTENEEGEKITMQMFPDAFSEALFVARKCKELVSSGYNPDEIAVLYRVNFVSRILEEAFLREGVQYQILGTRFFERKEIKDLLSFLKLALNKNSLVDLHRAASAVPRGLGKQTLLKIQENKIDELSGVSKSKVENFFSMLNEIENFALTHKVSETLKFVFEKSGLKAHLEDKKEEERIMNIFELIELSKKYDQFDIDDGLYKFLEESALSQDQDELSDNKSGVKLMTVHASKGLEFDTVFTVACEQGIFPVEKEDADDKEEERRLFYVSVTRAKKKLYITHACARQVYGNTSLQEPSVFLSDIPQELIQEIEQDPESSSHGAHDRGVDLIDW